MNKKYRIFTRDYLFVSIIELKKKNEKINVKSYIFIVVE